MQFNQIGLCIAKSFLSLKLNISPSTSSQEDSSIPNYLGHIPFRTCTFDPSKSGSSSLHGQPVEVLGLKFVCRHGGWGCSAQRNATVVSISD